MQRTKIVIVDDHRLFADSLKSLLEPEYEVAAIFEDGEQLIAGVNDINPEVVILDVGMPRMNGLTASSHLKRMLPKVKVVFLSMFHENETIGEAFRTGASAYVLKTSAALELKAAIREVLRGGYFATPCLTEGMLGSFVQNFKRMIAYPELTVRQKEVLQLLSEGLSMKQVAHRLNIAPRTVAFHKYTMMDELGVGSSAELISFAIKHGFAGSASSNLHEMAY